MVWYDDFMVINNPLIYSATQKTERADTSIVKSVRNLGLDISLQINLENISALSEVYNQILDISLERNVDCLILVHDDVTLTEDPIPKLEKLFEVYDVIGVAGCSKAEINSPALWHLMGGGFGGGNLHGSVDHNVDGEVFNTYFGPYPHRVVMIDGVFMAFNRKAIETVRFDELNPCKYHFYDMNLLNYHNSGALKFGVGDIKIIHESPGLREFTNDWRTGESYFISKYEL